MSSSSQEIVLATSPDGPIVAYDAATGTPLATFNSSRSPRRGITMAGRAFIAVSHISPVTASGSIHLYNWWASSTFQNLSVPEPVAPLAATSDGLYLFAGGISGHVHTLSLPSGDILNSMPAHSKPVSCLELNGDGSLLISGGDDGDIVVIPIFQLVQAKANENSRKYILHNISAHTDSVTSIYSMGQFSSQVISTSLDCRSKFWCLLSGTPLLTVVFPCGIFSMVLNPTETEFFAAGSDGLVYKGSLRQKTKHLVGTACELTTWAPRHDGAVVSVILVNQGQTLISAAEDGSIWVWEVNKEEVIMALKSEMGSISDLIAARGSSQGKGKRFTGGGCGGDGGGGSFRSGELSEAIKQTVGMRDVVGRVGSDVRRGVEMLESAIAIYEKMLELILKEAKAPNRWNDNKRENDD